MDKIDKKPYFIQWLFIAFTYPFNVSDLVAAILGLLLYFILWLLDMTNSTLWILVGTLGGIVFVRLLLAPYWIFKRQEKAIATISQQRQSKTIRNLFVVAGDQFEVGEPKINGYPDSKVKRIIRMRSLLTAIPKRRVESLHLELLGKTINTDWEPQGVANLPSGKYCYFDIPDSIKAGTYTVKLVAFSEGNRDESENYEIKIP